MSSKAKISIYILAYFAVNLLFLTAFPFVHSDEPWLSGLTRAFMNTGTISATEPFFNLYPRNPHAVKTLFHLIQAPFIAVLGYNIFALRLVSMLFSAGSLVVLYKIALHVTEKPNAALIAMIAVSLDVQYLYASHFARQEIVILFAALTAFYLLLRDRTGWAAVTTGIAIGVHPNAFVIATICGAVLFGKWRKLIRYAAITACFCAAFVALSLSMDNNFLQNYPSYGQNFQTSASPLSKLKELAPYLGRIFNRVAGTYYLPDIRPQMALLTPAAFILLAAGRKRNPKAIPLAAAIFGALAGIVTVGRYNQLYIVFILPFVYLLFVSVASVRKSLLLTFAVLVLTLSQLATALPKTYGKYDEYLAEIAEHVPPDAVTLCNLNAEYYFDHGALIDYRNLTHMRENGISFGEYVREYGIEYIVLSDEIEFIYRIRPKFNAVYGNINYYDDMTAFLERECELLHSFNDSLYGMRIVAYQGREDCNIRIYKVNR